MKVNLSVEQFTFPNFSEIHIPNGCCLVVYPSDQFVLQMFSSSTILRMVPLPHRGRQLWLFPPIAHSKK